MHPDGYHPACLLFPKLTGPALDELAADIKDRGLIEPIVLSTVKSSTARTAWQPVRLPG